MKEVLLTITNVAKGQVNRTAEPAEVPFIEIERNVWVIWAPAVDGRDHVIRADLSFRNCQCVVDALKVGLGREECTRREKGRSEEGEKREDKIPLSI